MSKRAIEPIPTKCNLLQKSDYTLHRVSRERTELKKGEIRLIRVDNTEGDDKFYFRNGLLKPKFHALPFVD
jgi:hypothetical protein